MQNENGETKKAKRHKPTSPQQVEMIKGVVEGKTITQSAIDAGYSPTSAHVTGSWILKHHKDDYLALLAAKGATPEKLAEVHVDGLEAMTIKDGRVVKDYHARHKYLDSAYDLMGVKAPKLIDVSFGLDPDFLAEIKRRASA